MSKPGRSERNAGHGHSKSIRLTPQAELLIDVVPSRRKVDANGTDSFTVTVIRAKKGPALTVDLRYIGLGVKHGTDVVSGNAAGTAPPPATAVITAANVHKESAKIYVVNPHDARKLLVIAKTAQHYATTVITLEY